MGHRKRSSSRGQIAYDNMLTMGESTRSLATTQQQSQNQLNTAEKPCHSARLALLCAQNVSKMGARTQLSLCPPGKNRRALQAALRKKNLESQQQLQNMSQQKSSGATQIIGLEKLIGPEQLEDYEVQEEEFLLNYQTDSDEEASSGDEDDLLDIDNMFSEESIDLDGAEAKYKSLSEPLFAPATAESSASGSQGSKYPFNRRKLRYFDAPTAEEAVTTRAYVKKEMQRSRQRAAQALCRHLKKVQSSSESSRRRGDPVVSEQTEELDTFVAPFEPAMTPAMAASLLHESLIVNPYESIEGIAACYDGIVAAGVALLEVPDPTQPSKTRASRSEIMAALAPLLITTLEQPSGEVILMLARLRRLCGTARYQRRFVQRIAPALIRPPGAAMWCLRHQNDMEAVFAATELILDAAFDVFAKGWYERGRWMLADSKRAETLSAAAQQLRNMSQEPADGLAFLHPQQRARARHITSHNEAEPLAEWEVVAVDRQIRVSISSVLQTDWTRATEKVHETVPRPVRHRSTANNWALASPRTPRSPRQSSASPRLTHVAPLEEAPRAASPPPPSSAAEATSLSPKNSGSMHPPKSPKSPHRGLSSGMENLSPKRTVMALSTPSLTPLSPSASSVGSTGGVGSGGAGDMVSYRPASSSTAGAATGGPASHYRMLTSTAAERKRTVAACRALRAQISRFEDAFVQTYGRPPKGASDRAPLATTYAQYREWKRAIRADAACRIQALFRGASCRWKLLRIGNAAVTRVIMKRAGRTGGRESVISQISLPADIVQPQQQPSEASVQQEGFGSAGSQQPVAPPQWGGQGARQRSNSNGSAEGIGTPSSPLPYTQSPPTASPTQTDTSNMSFADLQARKRDLKQQLKQYDMNFARKHGRMPVKAEKEPIRHLYEAYNSLKSQITQMEREGKHLVSTASPPAPGPVQQRTVSPPSGSEGSEDSAAGSRISPNPVPRNKRKLPKPSNAPSSVSSSAASTSTGTLAVDGQDLAALKVEKSNLHTMLRSYEKDFFRENNRQVSSFADIKPVASQYRRYKEIKKAIAAMQQSEK